MSNTESRLRFQRMVVFAGKNIPLFITQKTYEAKIKERLLDLQTCSVIDQKNRVLAQQISN